MKKSFVWAIAAVAFLGVSLRAMCGKCESSGGDCEKWKAETVATRVTELKKQLNLTADQEATVKAAVEAEVAESCEHKKAMNEKMDHAHTDASAKIKAVLTPEQQAKLDEIHSQGMKPCCMEAAKKGEKCTKCGMGGMKPCCLDAAKKGELCKKCPGKKAAACCPAMGGESKKK